MPTRLVSFLGLGPKDEAPHYSETHYVLDGRQSSSTPLLEQALTDLLPDVAGVFVLGTEQVKKRWFDTGLFGERVSRPFSLVEPTLPVGETPEDCWKIFEAMARAVSLEPLTEIGERQAPDVIVVDVTHGFRLQPILGLAALSFVLSEWARQNVPNPPSVRVLYGAWEARDKDRNVSPIWDLTEFVTASRWNAALDALMRYGRADDLERIGKELGKSSVSEARSAGRQGEELRQAQFPSTFVSAAKAFADDLALARLQSLLTQTAPALRSVLGKEEVTRLVESIPPLKDSVRRLGEWVAPLCSPNTLGQEGLAATAHLSRLLGSLQRFAEQAAVVREGLITHYRLQTTGEALPEPGKPAIAVLREAAESEWAEVGKTNQKQGVPALPTGVARNITLSAAAANTRNDIEHCGINPNPSTAARLRNSLEKQTSEFFSLVCGEGSTTDRVPAKQPRHAFLNLSNHPISLWPPDQLAAARALGLGEPEELDGGMPHMPPQADEAETLRLARDVAERAVAQGAAGAFVASDFTFTFALIHELRDRGVRCFSATTEREAEDRTLPDGATEKSSVFRFVRWREYR